MRYAMLLEGFPYSGLAQLLLYYVYQSPSADSTIYLSSSLALIPNETSLLKSYYASFSSTSSP